MRPDLPVCALKTFVVMESGALAKNAMMVTIIITMAVRALVHWKAKIYSNALTLKTVIKGQYAILVLAAMA